MWDFYHDLVNNVNYIVAPLTMDHTVEDILRME